MGIMIPAYRVCGVVFEAVTANRLKCALRRNKSRRLLGFGLPFNRDLAPCRL
jgi:hypothetical protein